MCAPSTSASVIRMILWYRAFSMSNSSRTPVPIAVMSAWTSLLASTLSMRAFSTLRILPRSGSTAWVCRSRPCLAEPPAESPSTTKISARDGSLTEQSASLPGSFEFSRALLRRVRSRALRAAERAWAAWTALRTIARASAGFSSRNSARPALTIFCTCPAIPGLPSFVLVCPSNCGSASLTEMIAVRPSRTSSPESSLSFSFSSPLALAQRLICTVSAERKPDMCEPPSCVLMLFAKEKTDSW